MAAKPATRAATIDVRNYFFPLVLVRSEAGGWRIVEHLGTASFFLPSLVVTCWHCVRNDPPPGHFYALRVTDESGGFFARPLSRIERDRNGTDMATAHCDYPGAACVSLAEAPPFLGADVYTYGYPFPVRGNDHSGNPTFEISGRFLKTYIARDFYYDHPEYGRTEAYELGAPAPQGHSGCALLNARSLHVVGIIFASHDVETIEEFLSVDPTTGQREPEVRRIVSFGLAYDFDELSRLKTDETGGHSLVDFLRQQEGRKVSE